MYAIFETGGKQYKVQKGDVIYVEKLENPEGETVNFENVIFIDTDKAKKIGSPFVKGASITATIDKTGKAKKITVFTYKRRKNQKRTMGHRQPYTRLVITDIKASAKAE